MFIAGCGGSGGSGGPAAAPQTAQTAFVRFVDASPDIETPSAQTGATATCNFQTTDPVLGALVSVQAGGAQVAAAFPFGAVTNYVAVPSGALQISVVPPSALQNGCANYSTSITTVPGSYQTVAVTGQYASSTLAFTTYADAQAASTGAQFYNASPSAHTIDAGEFTPGKTDYRKMSTVLFGSSTALSVPTSAVGFYAGTGSVPLQTLLPSAVDTFDTQNVVPFNNEKRFSVFLLDGGVLVGSFN